jgi:hypothetical protein
MSSEIPNQEVPKTASVITIAVSARNAIAPILAEKPDSGRMRP